MTSKLDLITAVDLSIKHWEAIAKSKELLHPLDVKEKELGKMKAEIKKYGDPESACWLCQALAIKNGNENCTGCPIEYNGRWCLASVHPYHYFRSSTTLEDRTRHAEDVVKILKKWRSEHEKN